MRVPGDPIDRRHPSSRRPHIPNPPQPPHIVHLPPRQVLGGRWKPLHHWMVRRRVQNGRVFVGLRGARPIIRLAHTRVDGIPIITLL